MKNGECQIGESIRKEEDENVTGGLCFFFFKQKTAYEIGTGDWSSDVCSSVCCFVIFQCFQLVLRYINKLETLKNHKAAESLTPTSHIYIQQLEAAGP